MHAFSGDGMLIGQGQISLVLLREMQFEIVERMQGTGMEDFWLTDPEIERLRSTSSIAVPRSLPARHGQM